jgi:hypothetical protein
MHKLIGAACHRTAGLAAGLVLTGGLIGGVLLTPGTAYATTYVPTSTAITGVQQSSGSHGTTLDVSVSVTPSSGTASPTGTVKVSDGSGTCLISLSEQGSSAVGVGSCDIYNVWPGSYTVSAQYYGSSTMAGSSTSESVTVGSSPAFTADSPPLTATRGLGYSYTFQASGSPAPTYSLGGGAPSWLNINSSTGAVWGTVPWWAGSFSYTVTASNSSGSVTAGPFNVWVRHAYSNININTSLSCPSKVWTGKRGECTLSVTNNGSNTATDVNAQIALPKQLRADYCGYLWNWQWGCSISNNTAYENLGSLAPGQTKALSVVFTAKSGWSLFGWNHGWRFNVEVVGSATAGNSWWYGQRSSTSDAWVTIVPHGHWW